MGMGVAEAIPGVSGGTIAFLTGIYERLIKAIRNVDGALLRLILRGQWKASFQRVDGMFLVSLFIGMTVGLIVSVFAISWFLENYPTVVWGFFFGLIASSAVWMLRGVHFESYMSWVILLLGVAVAFVIAQSAPAQGSKSLIYVFACGMIAICALVLPGISGSFILLLLGMYTLVINTVKSFLTTLALDDLLILVCFGLGCIIGLGLFVRMLNWAYLNYKEKVIILLCGFMIGSLWKIWPWRNPTLWLDENGLLHSDKPDFTNPYWMEEIRVLSEANVLPGQYDPGQPYLWATLLFTTAGALIVWLFPNPGYTSRSED